MRLIQKNGILSSLYPKMISISNEKFLDDFVYLDIVLKHFYVYKCVVPLG